MHAQCGGRICSIAAILGAAFLFVGTYLHPMSADPNMSMAAFIEYAEDQHWMVSHLMQFFGIVLIVAALVLLSRNMASGPAAQWVALGAAGAIASLAMAGALQAVDGVALKRMVNTWVEAADPEKTVIFHVAFGVRQIEIGLASITGFIFGLTISIYGIALLIDHRFSKWMGALGIVGGIGTAIAGIVIAYTGFSNMAMAINLLSGALLIVWLIVIARRAWRRPTF
jgi:hypothetical protein